MLGETSLYDARIKKADFSAKLYESIDGRQPSEFQGNADGQTWMNGRTSIISGKTYREFLKLRIGRLPTLANCNRGQDVNKKCNIAAIRISHASTGTTRSSTT